MPCLVWCLASHSLLDHLLGPFSLHHWLWASCLDALQSVWHKFSKGMKTQYKSFTFLWVHLHDDSSLSLMFWLTSCILFENCPRSHLLDSIKLETRHIWTNEHTLEGALRLECPIGHATSVCCPITPQNVEVTIRSVHTKQHAAHTAATCLQTPWSTSQDPPPETWWSACCRWLGH